ncbi:hypothetical protein GH714_043336 [Hevea brasiliensis]|uniref:Amine oxidase domain-containing protein n=1 Tax=Hevea brasiliensis TaxID=3981 RepID=A0A6A6K4A2_HEVBR|nr:hypothetical protein GH714_043336 [Hevea brasiliensis]
MVLLFLLCFFLAAASASPSPTVIVIGAGISGIAAAKTLHEAGIHDMLIVEATPRIGGRLMKTQFSGLTVEKGANWLFGGGLWPIPCWTLPKNLSSELPSMTMKISHQTPLNKKVDYTLPSWVPKTPLEMVIDFYHNDYEDAEPPKVTSLKHTYPRNEFVDHGEDPYFVADPRGFEIVVQYLAKQFLSSLTSDPRLKLNKVVREISYSKSGVTIKTEDGSTYNSKYVIVSVSLGVLQSDLIEFQPTLPVSSFRICFLNFPNNLLCSLTLNLGKNESAMEKNCNIRLWHDHIYQDLSKVPLQVLAFRPGTEFFLYTHVRRGYYPLWQHLENEYPGSNILFVTVTADESRRIEQLPDEAIEAEIMVILKKFFGDNIPKPESILVPRWGLDRFYKGSYSNWPDSYSQKRKDQLADPIGPVYFTGEHTSNNYIGYATGAYFAGIDTANDLIECFKKKSCRGYNRKMALRWEC